VIDRSTKPAKNYFVTVVQEKEGVRKGGKKREVVACPGLAAQQPQTVMEVTRHQTFHLGGRDSKTVRVIKNVSSFPSDPHCYT
jgi:hypothetical protein